MRNTIYLRNKRGIFILCSIFIFLFSLNATMSFTQEKTLPGFKDLKEDTEKFINYYYNINLSASEHKILQKALSEIPAPCCSDHTALTC